MLYCQVCKAKKISTTKYKILGQAKNQKLEFNEIPRKFNQN